MSVVSFLGGLVVGSSGLGGRVGGRDKDVLSSSIGGSIGSGGGSSVFESFMCAIRQKQDFLDNPPRDYTSEKAAEVRSWAGRQIARVDAERIKVSSDDYDRLDQLYDAKCSLTCLVEKANVCLDGDASLDDFGY